MGDYTCRYFQGWQDMGFPTSATQYDPRIAWWMVQSSQLAYENKLTAATELRNAKFGQVTFFDAQGTQAFLAVHPDVQGSGEFAILAFRGTEKDSIDVLTDINFIRRLLQDQSLGASASKYYAHGGFLDGVENVWGSALWEEVEAVIPGKCDWRDAPGISDAIRELPADTPLYITGHSLGGALATLAAYKMLVYRDVAALYTFGSPRTAQTELAATIDQALRGRSFRVVNSNDVVPRLPPRIPLMMEFRHIESLHHFNQARKTPWRLPIWLDTGVLALAVLELLLALITLKRYVPTTLKNHMIAEYLKDIQTELGL